MKRPDSVEESLDHIRNGNLDQAELTLRRGLAETPSGSGARALERVATMKALYLLATDRLAEAQQMLMHYLQRFPRSTMLHGSFLSMLSEARKLPDQATGRLVLGLGTGRSGSTSLTMLLQQQDDTYVSHEHAPALSWRDADARFEFHLQRFRLLAKSWSVVGDVSHWWLPRLERVLAEFPDARCIVLRRDMRATISSFLRIKGGEGKGAINHWIAHDGQTWRRNSWDECYPKYEASSVSEAIGAYWQDYYRTSEMLQSQFPANVRVFELEDLSSEVGQKAILQFAGFPAPRTSVNLRANQNTAHDGEKMIPALFG